MKAIPTLLNGLMWGASRIPLPLLYGVADVLAWLAHDVVRYRRKMVDRNLASCLPELSEKERRRAARRFYRFLGDYFVETLRLHSMSEREMKERMRFENIDEVIADLRSGRDVSLYLGHYGNWEWVSSLPLHFPEDVVCGQIYHPLTNKTFDELFLGLRERFGAHCIPMARTLRQLVTWKRDGKTSIVGYIADQRPTSGRDRHWLRFLHHETDAITGAEEISRRLKAAVYYVDMVRLDRGRYCGRFVKICEDASVMPQPHSITDEYYHLLEASIRRDPPYWLWSHNRFKHIRKNR
ncbi:MAG: lysophospholipid acyltransferase family protein [Bacteroides sp.]|nr:lysophospholipid acyltransferase family protein [Bacteroides sp.]